MKFQIELFILITREMIIYVNFNNSPGCSDIAHSVMHP